MSDARPPFDRRRRARLVLERVVTTPGECWELDAIPEHGDRPHLFGESCWCCPRKILFRDTRTLIVHNQVH